MSRHLRRVMVPAKASSASSLCSAAAPRHAVAATRSAMVSLAAHAVPTKAASDVSRSSLASTPARGALAARQHGVAVGAIIVDGRAPRRRRQRSRARPSEARDASADRLATSHASTGRQASDAGARRASARATQRPNGSPADELSIMRRARAVPPMPGASSSLADQADRAVMPGVRVRRRSAYQVRRTPAISCEAVPASEMGRRGHEPALPPVTVPAKASSASSLCSAARARIRSQAIATSVRRIADSTGCPLRTPMRTSRAIHRSVRAPPRARLATRPRGSDAPLPAIGADASGIHDAAEPDRRSQPWRDDAGAWRCSVHAAPAARNADLGVAGHDAAAQRTRRPRRTK